MMNSIDELYPLLRFLRVSRYNDWKTFSIEIGKVSEYPLQLLCCEGLQDTVSVCA
jgi:hypothetical protein